MGNLTDLFRRLGAPDPAEWGQSEIQQGIPQLARFVFLRGLWDQVLRCPPESRETGIEVARMLCYLLDGRPALLPPEISHLNWGLFLKNDERPTQPLGGLVESFEDTRPEGHVWGSLTTVVTLRQATDADLGPALSGLEHLESLWLGGTAVTDQGLVSLRYHPTLRVLDLSGTAITDAGVTELSQLPNLTALYLADTCVTDRGLAVLGTLPKLNTLNLDNTAITDSGVAHLAQRETLEFVTLKGTGVSKTARAKLMHRFPEATVHFDQ